MLSASAGNRTSNTRTRTRTRAASLHIHQYHPLNKSCSAVQQWSGAKGSLFNSVTPTILSILIFFSNCAEGLYLQ
jgi:hypothetical protein